jgi:23S rRNA maturation-related 3'-5' exoribonuclease YhaM
MKKDQEEMVNQAEEHALLMSQGIGSSFAGIYYVESAYVKLTAQNKKYTDLILRDKSGGRNVKYWGTVQDVNAGTFVLVSAMVEDYQGSPSIIAKNLEKVDDPDDLSDFIAVFENIKEVEDRFVQLVDQVVKMESQEGQETCTLLLGEVFDANEALYQKFVESPGSENPYYGRMGGLLVSTVNVAENVMALAGRYEMSNMEKAIALTSALLHKIGAVDGFEFKNCLPKTTKKGLLLGLNNLTFNRMSIAIRKAVAEAKAQGKAVSQELILLILHAVSSYDETSVKPMSKEALLLSAAVKCDKEMVESFDFISNDLNTSEEFTAYDVRKGRKYLRGA